jgi:hypothetical protein
MARLRLNTAQGLYLLATGMWPLVHYRSFEWVTGPKSDRWLVQTVAGLGVTAGWAMLRAGRSTQGQDAARRLGVGSALTFGLIDVVYGGSGRIRRIYLADSAVEAAWLVAWAAQARQAPERTGRGGRTVGSPDPETARGSFANQPLEP